MVGLPMAYLTAVSSAIYLVSALLLRATSGFAFPLLPVAAWIAAFTLIVLAATWSIRNKAIPAVVSMLACAGILGLAVGRLTAVELPGGYDWPPRLWPTLFDFPLTDYAWIALIGVASFGVTVASVAAQRRGDVQADISWSPGIGLRAWLTSLFSIPCPTSSAMRAQVWFDLKFSGLPVLTIGVALATVILLLGVVSNPLDAAINAVFLEQSCLAKNGCFHARAWTVLFTAFSLPTVLFFGGNALGIRPFEAIQAYGTAQLTALKLLVRSACYLAAFIAVGVSAWTSLSVLGDEIFIAMWSVPLSSQLRAINGAVAALTGYEHLALVVVAVIGVVVWVAAFAALRTLWKRYFRRMNLAASVLLLYGFALVLLALAARNGSASEYLVDALFRATRWGAVAAMVLATVYFFWSGFAEHVLTIRYAIGAVAISAAFGAAWVTVLSAAGLQLAAMSTTNAVWMLSPMLLPLLAIVLAPWSLNRLRHT
jgi:hypothetical protein